MHNLQGSIQEWRGFFTLNQLEIYIVFYYDIFLMLYTASMSDFLSSLMWTAELYML